MSDNTLRCALVYRLESFGDPVLLAKYDHESAYEDRNSSYSDAVGMVVGSDPPGAVAEEGVVGGFKVVQSDMHQIVYGSDSEGLCEFVDRGIFILALKSSARSFGRSSLFGLDQPAHNSMHLPPLTDSVGFEDNAGESMPKIVETGIPTI